MRQLNPILFIVLLFLSCNHATIRMDNFEVHGIDVSHYQSKIDWQKVAEQEIHFAFAKASEGATLVDTMFCTNWELMHQVGIIRGAYHFFRPKVSAQLQAQNFMQQLSLKVGDLPPVLDVEVLDGTDPVRLIQQMKKWLFLVEKELHIQPIIYTNQKFYNEHLAGHFENHIIWIARYNSIFQPNLKENRHWSFWQYGNRGQLEGIQGFVDFNIFNGPFIELQNLCVTPIMPTAISMN